MPEINVTKYTSLVVSETIENLVFKTGLDILPHPHPSHMVSSYLYWLVTFNCLLKSKEAVIFPLRDGGVLQSLLN